MADEGNLGQYTVTVVGESASQMIQVPQGTNLRRALLQAGISPYGALSKRANCGGRGLCATCGVIFDAGEPAPAHWHDRIGSAFGYPRLSCQIEVTNDMTIRLVAGKVMWGPPDWSRRWKPRAE